MAAPVGALRQALEHAASGESRRLGDLVALASLPSVSATVYRGAALEPAAEQVAALLRSSGLSGVELLGVAGAPPYVYGEWLSAAGAPTVLAYGHYDVQPPGDPAAWRTPPFAPAVRRGRLYARGAADDKGGVVALAAAIGSYLGSSGALPLNVKVLIEGEEEIGSPHLARLLARQRRRLGADALVVVDTPNFATGIPALTCQLRGSCTLDVEVRCLRRPLHSGRGAGAVPDAALALCTLLASLYRADGSLDVPGLEERLRPPSPAQRARLKRLPFDEGRFRRDAGMLPGIRFTGPRRLTLLERVWTRPALTITALEARPLAEAANQLLDVARARLSLRTVPDLEPEMAGELLRRRLTRRPPFGARVSVRPLGGVPWWSTDADGAACAAALRALQAGYRRPPRRIAAGGSIGFLRPFSELMGGAPCLLMGVEDPPCNAHAANESLHLGDWRRAVRSLVHLFDELSRDVLERAAAT
jgi:acetylornithine deacetylase/succinyl-diaminopimelate desuccinylase-like protein